MVTNNERDNTFDNLPEAIKELYSSPVATALNKEITNKYNIEGEAKRKFLNVTGDVILGFYKISDLPKLLQKEVGLEKETSQKLVAGLIDAWGLIVQREAEEAQAKKAAVASLADKIEAIKPTEQNQGFKPEPAITTASGPENVETPETQAYPETATEVKPIRTMSSDAGKIHGYGALPENQDIDTEPVIKATPQDEIKSTNL